MTEEDVIYSVCAYGEGVPAGIVTMTTYNIEQAETWLSMLGERYGEARLAFSVTTHYRPKQESQS